MINEIIKNEFINFDWNSNKLDHYTNCFKTMKHSLLSYQREDNYNHISFSNIYTFKKFRSCLDFKIEDGKLSFTIIPNMDYYDIELIKYLNLDKSLFTPVNIIYDYDILDIEYTEEKSSIDNYNFILVTDSKKEQCIKILLFSLY